MSQPSGHRPCVRRRWLVRLLPFASVLLSHCTSMSTPPSHPPKLGAAAWTASDEKTLPFQRWPDTLEPAKSAPAGTTRPADARAQRRVTQRPAGTPSSLQAGHPHAIVICMHGLSGAASDFWPLGQELPKRDLLVYAPQLRGQGHDPDLKTRGDISSSRRWQRDLREFTTLVRERHPGVPVFWLGESMGSLIVMQTAARRPLSGPFSPPDGVLLLSPAVGLRERLPVWKEWLVRTANHVIPARRIDIAKLDSKRVPTMQVTRHTTQASQTPLTPHAVTGQSIRLLLEVDKMMQQSNDAARALTLPVLVLYTPNDPIVTREQVERWFEHIDSADKTRLFYPEDYHLILHDDHRWQAVEQIGDWLLRRATPAAPAKRPSTKKLRR